MVKKLNVGIIAVVNRGAKKPLELKQLEQSNLLNG
jgi:hypothetical protein